MRYIGQGLSSLETFCSLMCLPNPVSQKAYDRINAKIADISEALANASMKKAAAEEKIIDGTVNSVVVSGDGTWKTSGHTSLIGVCALIGADCGKVLDMEVMSSYCKGCDSNKGPKFGPKYSAFLAKHQIFCRKNRSGSAEGMEVCGMQKIFFQSEQKHGLKYQRYIGDGDSKTFSSIAEKKPYEDSVPIEKIECVGHVQKRMGNRLRKLKALWGEKKLSDGKTIGGKGRLTDAFISKLTTFYGNAIRANSHNVNEMRQAVWAVWAHTSSTDDEPKHWFCPKGKNSWCKYNVSVPNNTVNEFSHKNTLPKAVSEVIKPVFKDLSHLKLLRSCQVNYSQFGLAIHQNDHQARRRFVQWAQNEIAVVPHFHKRILFSDEAHFWLNGYVNKQICRIWSEANPQVYVETPLHPEKLTVWCALWAGGILLQKR
ncbi:uncharacterized protein TNCV_1848171 [Trichonephila clavipes]|nr:uncharacterized protein TNCV_1848171 [Trichonephila clavipes]